MIEAGASATAQRNVLVVPRILAAVLLKGHALRQAVASASLDGEVLPATANAQEVFPNLAITTEYAHLSAIARVSRGIFPSTAVLNAKVVLVIPATGMAFANRMALVNVASNTEGVLAKQDAPVRTTDPMDMFVWTEDFAIRWVSVNALAFMQARTVLS